MLIADFVGVLAALAIERGKAIGNSNMAVDLHKNKIHIHEKKTVDLSKSMQWYRSPSSAVAVWTKSASFNVATAEQHSTAYCHCQTRKMLLVMPVGLSSNFKHL